MNLLIYNSLLENAVKQIFEDRTKEKTLEIEYDLNKSVDQKKEVMEKRFASQSRKKNTEQIGLDAIEFINNKAGLIVEEITIKLQLSSSKAKGCYLKNKELKELLNEKSKVKKELIYYDEQFLKHVKRKPNGKEKEKMIRSYIYYSNLKQAINRFNKQKKQVKNEKIEKLENLNEKLFSLIRKKESLRKFLLNYKDNFESQYGRVLNKLVPK